MDGNGRWAQHRGRPRSFGHREGQKAVRNTIRFCRQRGIGALTLFAFSSENWKRPVGEVGALMQLFLRALEREVAELDANGVRLRFIGELDAFSPELRDRMQQAMQRTKPNQALQLNVAVNYGGRWDIVQAARRLATETVRGEIEPAAIDEARFQAATSLAEMPPVDLLIRTGGERRVSNFLLWQLAYAELYFTETLWPDVDDAALEAALADYALRERRYGRTSSQIRAAG